MNSKILTYMGFAKKSGNLVSGVNTCTFNMSRRKVKLMILAEDISPGSEKKIMKEIRRYGVNYVKYGNIDEMSHATGGQGRSVFGILDDNFAGTILKAIEDECGN
ncbi:MAG: ribosomal L7Ae/L30e/S12e/Gadd45 family protein [Firmicutes bacterium]|nr:ribosomal L7Ae/L30e/S12e/Gadd45 family protein [Bacillota bacterium]